MIKFLVSFFMVFSLSQSAFAWELQIGTKRLKPYIRAGEQTYESGTTTLDYKADPSGTVYGGSILLGVKSDAWSYIYEAAAWEYSSDYLATDATETTSLTIKNVATKLGISFSHERDLAGYHFGIGMANYSEKFSFGGEDYTFSSTSPYFSAGLDLVFGALIVRADQSHMSAGSHYIKTNAFALIFSF